MPAHSRGGLRRFPVGSGEGLYASMITGPSGTPMHRRQYPSSMVKVGVARYRTLPSSSRVRHVPHVPAWQLDGNPSP